MLMLIVLSFSVFGVCCLSVVSLTSQLSAVRVPIASTFVLRIYNVESGTPWYVPRTLSTYEVRGT
jgi:hypothetical protein